MTIIQSDVIPMRSLKRPYFQKADLLIMIWCLFLIQINSLAQTNLRITSHYGFIIPHREEIKNLIQGHSWGVNAEIPLHYRKEKFWHRAWSNPEQTWTITYLNTGNPKQLGTHYSILHQLYLPLQSPAVKRKISQYMALGIGLGYASKVWNATDNYQATVLSSHLNTALLLQYGCRLKRQDRPSISWGLRLAHFSNGSLKTPNLGTNNFSFFVATEWNGKSHMEEQHSDTVLSKEFSRFRMTGGYFFGLKEILPPGERKYFVNGLNIGFDARLNSKSSFTTGVDVMRNSSLPVLLQEKTGITSSVNAMIQWGAAIGYVMHFNRFELRFQQGLYCIDRYKEDGILYQRVVLRFYVTSRYWISVMLKTHFAKADYGEYGMGYALPWRQRTYTSRQR